MNHKDNHLSPSEFLKDFFTRNRAELEALPRYENRLSYDPTILPDSKSGLKIEDVPIFNRVVDEFLDYYILPYKSEIKIDLKGHLSGTDGITLEEVDQVPRSNRPLSMLSTRRIRKVLLTRLAILLSHGVKDGVIRMNGVWFMDECTQLNSPTCRECDLTIDCVYDFKTKTIKIPEYLDDIIPECPAQNSNGTASFTIQAPSGQLVFANNLRSLFRDEYTEYEDYDCSINSRLGRLQLAQRIGSGLGQIYAWVGDVDSHIVERKSDGKFFAVEPAVFAKHISKECDFEINDDGIEYEPECHLHGSLFRTVSAIDRDVFFQRQKELGEECKDYFVVDLKGKTSVDVVYDTNDDTPWLLKLTCQ